MRWPTPPGVGKLSQEVHSHRSRNSIAIAWGHVPAERSPLVVFLDGREPRRDDS